MAKTLLYNRPKWRPHYAGLGAAKRETTETLGVAILSALSITSVWSAVCPSYFTLTTFASRPEARGRAMNGCWIGLGLSTATAAAIWMVFHEPAAAIVAEATALALFGISLLAINSEAPADVQAMNQQPEALPAAPGVLQPV